MRKSSSSISPVSAFGADLSALWYLEYRQAVNRIRKIVRDPARVVMYAIVIVYFAFMGFVRSQHARAVPHSIAEPYASAMLFTYAALLSVVAYGAASGILGAFSSSADARFLAGSRISERLVVVWLQLRRSARSIGRMLLSILLYALIFYRSGTFGGIAFALTGGTLLATAIALPALKLRNVAGARTAQSVAGACAAVSILAMVVLFASLMTPIPAAGDIERIGAGAAFNALLQANPIALAALYGVGIAFIALSYAAGKDVYPDLYAASLKVLAFREKSKRGGSAAFAMEHAYERAGDRLASHAAVRGLRGAWSIAWKEWVGFVRSPSMKRVFWLGFVGCIAGGIIAGRAVARSSDPLGDGIALASMAANLIVIFVAMGSAIALANDLRKPLFWIGSDRLAMRLFAWVAGTSWRLAMCIAAGIFAWGLAMQQIGIALAGIPVSIAAVLYLRTVGLAIYSLFPSTVDQRGPLAIVRAFITYIMAAPPIAAAIVTALLLHAPAAGVAIGIAASGLETFALVAFAAARIDGRGFAFAEAETA